MDTGTVPLQSTVNFKLPFIFTNNENDDNSKRK